MPTLFEKIYRGEIPGFIVTETDHSFVIMNKYPVEPGHVLVIPKVPVPYVFDVSDEVYQDLWDLTRRVALAMRKVTGKEGIRVGVEGFDIKDHCHIHVMPLPEKDEWKEAKEASDEELKTWQGKLQKAL